MTLTGILAPIPTPFDDRDQMDGRRLQRALARWLKTRLTGFVVLGTTGEAALLNEHESDEVVAIARASVPCDRLLVVGTGRESTQAALRASRRAAELGADAVLVRTPGFFKSHMTSETFVRHYTAVADDSPIPVILYNFTAVTGVDLLPDAVSRLAIHPNIIGIKESSGDVARISELVAATPKSFRVITGSSTSFSLAVSAGASAGILALGCLLPGACSRLFELTREGREQEARALQEQFWPLGRLIGSTYGVAGLKAALGLIGCDVGMPRPPLAPVPETARAMLTDALAKFEEVAA